VIDPLAELKRIREQQERLRKQYAYWLHKAHDEGYANVQIARQLGISEAAVRMYLKRNPE